MADIEQKDILKLLKVFKSQYAKEGLNIVGLFGSYAKGESDNFSDVDIAYEIDRKTFSKKYSDGFSKILRIQEIKEKLEQALHKKVDFVSLQSGNQLFIDYVKQEIIYV